MQNEKSVEEVLALCDELCSSKLLFVDKKIQELLEGIVSCPKVYALLDECMSSFNKEKELPRALAVNSMGKGTFTMPKEEYKILSLTFCLLADIGAGKTSFDEIVSTFFVTDEGKKDYSAFMRRVIIPFKDILADAFNFKTEPVQEAPEKEEKVVSFPVEKTKFIFKDKDNLDKTFEIVKSVSVQMSDILENERRKDEVNDSLMMLSGLFIACEEEDFDLLYAITLGLKYSLKGIKSVKFLNNELQEIVKEQAERDEL